MIDKLRRIRDRLHEAEAAHSDSPALAALHQEALRLLHSAYRRDYITRAEFDELAAPQGGGTPKTPEPPGG